MGFNVRKVDINSKARLNGAGTGIADHLRIAFAQAGVLGGIQACIHAGQNRKAASDPDHRETRKATVLNQLLAKAQH